MRTFLVLEGAAELEAPGNEFRVISGSIMREAGLTAWAARKLGTPENAPFIVVAEAARAAGVTLFALPVRDVRPSDPNTVTARTTIAGRSVLILRQANGDGARVRWQGTDGGVRETEVPGFIADALSGGQGSDQASADESTAVDGRTADENAPEGP